VATSSTGFPASAYWPTKSKKCLNSPGVRTAEYRRRRDQQVRRLGRAYRRLGALVELLALDGGTEAGGERVNLDDLGRDVRVRGEAADDELGQRLRRDLGAEQLDRPQHLALRDVAEAHLNGHPVVVEQLPLVEDLVGYLLGAAEEERPGPGGLRLVGGQRHRDALAALVVVGHPAGLEAGVPPTATHSGISRPDCGLTSASCSAAGWFPARSPGSPRGASAET
jgi:hypothetical protein